MVVVCSNKATSLPSRELKAIRVKLLGGLRVTGSLFEAYRLKHPERFKAPKVGAKAGTGKLIKLEPAPVFTGGSTREFYGIRYDNWLNPNKLKY